MNHYEDLEQLIFKGFLTEKLHFNGFDFVLKSLTEQEFQRVNDRTPTKHPARSIIYDCWFLSYSILQVDGVYFLDNREETALRLFRSLIKWPIKAIGRLIHKCLTFNKRIALAYTKLEAYCYEDQSRVYWKAYQGIPLNSPAITGIEGTDKFALTPLQIQWAHFNRSEDEKVVFETQWSYVRWAGAFLNGKAAQKIDDEVTQQRDAERAYRDEVKARAKGISSGTDPLASPYSESAREDELKKLLYDLDVAVNNKKDAHELAMDKARLVAIEEYRAFRREEQERKIAAIKTQSPLQEGTQKSPFEIFDQNSMSEIKDIQKRRELITSVLGVSAAELDAIDKEFEVPAELLQSLNPISNTARSTILPINVTPGNFSPNLGRPNIPREPLP